MVLLEFGLLNLSFITTYLLSRIPVEAEGVDFFSNFLPLLLMLNLGWAIIMIWRVDPKVYLKNSFQGRVRFMLLNAFILVGLIYTIDSLLQFDVFRQINNLWPLLIFVFQGLVAVSEAAH